ncbi:hypothetical protein D3879_04150 [Pseudomonas cavernicola]|uniref:Uncharacterized protein n=1 Tax=Pseudomonas cavernicola TaxID=2320866 RepID=A0A418XJ50_9PSED|nr:hypothetical protein [Pseudomonas cavernicola]RJG12490.1 hypothetical protein D3879_04150 [Pseudomonas cavernicola]
MSMPPLRLQHWLLFALVALLFFAWGGWLMRAPDKVAPLPGLAEWQSQVLTPLAENQLTLSRLSAVAEGELWLQPRLDGPRLLYRAELAASGEVWQLEAELALSDSERVSLMAATGLEPKDAEQPLSQQLLAQLGSHALATLTLTPLQPVSGERVAASLGQPRLRLELAEGEAWVYPLQGLTAHLQDDQLQLLRVVPRRALEQH